MRTRRNVSLGLSLGTMLAGAILLVPLGTAEAEGLTASPPPVLNGQVTISTPAQLEYVDRNQTAPIASGSSTSYLAATIVLVPGQAFNMAGLPWVPFGGNADPFSGSFNGHDDVIEGITLDDSTSANVGFFGNATGTVDNLGLVNETITGNAQAATGGLVGQLSGSIQNVYTAGAVADGGNTGGIVGAQSNGVIENTISTASVTASYGNNGGIVGFQWGGTVKDCLATGAISGDSSANGGLLGEQDGDNASVSDSYATGNVSGGTENGGIVGDQYTQGSIADVYATGTVSGPSSGGIAGYQDVYQSGIQNAVYRQQSTLPSIGTPDGNPSNGTLTSATTSQMQLAYTSSSSPFHSWMTEASWTQVSGVNDGLPLLMHDQMATVAPNNVSVTVGQSMTIPVGAVYPVGQTTAGSLEVAPIPGLTVSLSASEGNWADSTVTTTSTGTADVWSAPLTAGTAVLSAILGQSGFGATAIMTVSAAPPAPVWTLPTFTPESVTIGGVSGEVIGNWGYNPAVAVDNGTYFGYIEERAAVEAGTTFSGEGTNSSYLSAILDGSGVGLQQHVSAVQQGQFAALYQKLGIIPTWINNTVSIPQGVAALVKAGAPALAIENYLVQFDGFSWEAVQAQAAAGFPM